MKIICNQLSVYRDKKLILDRIDCKIQSGQFIAIIGANGSGKSTLLESIGGFLPYQKGSILFDHIEISQWKPKDLARHRAILRQKSDLNLSFTVEEIVLMGRTPHINKHETRSDLNIVYQALHLVGLAGFEHRLYTQLSGGEQQRVHLARVLAQVWIPNVLHSSSKSVSQDLEQTKSTLQNKAVLLLDEPTASLDMKATHQVLNCASRFAQAGGTVICILHDMNLVTQYANQVMVLREGKIIAFGPPRKILTNDTMEHAFDVNAVVLHDTHLKYPVIVTHS